MGRMTEREVCERSEQKDLLCFYWMEVVEVGGDFIK